MLERNHSLQAQILDSPFARAYKGLDGSTLSASCHTSAKSKFGFNFHPRVIILVERLCQKIRRRAADGTALPSELENLAIMEEGLKDAVSGNPAAALNNIPMQCIMDMARVLKLKVSPALLS